MKRVECRYWSSLLHHIIISFVLMFFIKFVVYSNHVIIHNNNSCFVLCSHILPSYLAWMLNFCQSCSLIHDVLQFDSAIHYDATAKKKSFWQKKRTDIEIRVIDINRTGLSAPFHTLFLWFVLFSVPLAGSKHNLTLSASSRYNHNMLIC